MKALVVAGAIVWGVATAPAVDRHALVICNDEFQNGDTAPGAAARADAAQAAFEEAGFEVTRVDDTNDLRRVFEAYAPRCPGGGVSAVYYAGIAHRYPSKRDRRVKDADGKEVKEVFYVPESGVRGTKSDYRIADMARIFRDRSAARLHLFLFDGMRPNGKVPAQRAGLFEPDLAEWPSGLLWYGAPPETVATSPAPEFRLSGTAKDFAQGLGGWSVFTSALMGRQDLVSRVSLRSDAPPAKPKPGQAWTDRMGLTFCWCPPGEFTMGIGDDSDPQTRDSPKVAVTLSEGFWMQKYEFSLGDYWRARQRSYGTRDILVHHGNRPLTAVKGPGALDMGPKLVTSAAKKAGGVPEGWEYRLPTEAEWEYACRAGGSGAFAFGDSMDPLAKHANYADAALLREDDSFHYADAGSDDLGGIGPMPIGCYAPNAWGLHDMHGNVSEFVFDHYVPTLPGGTDPRVRVEKGDKLVLRGGAWCSTAAACRAGYRNHTRLSNNDGQSNWRGLRLVLAKKK